MRPSIRRAGGKAGKRRRVVILALLASSLAGCVRLHQARLGEGEEPTLIGPAVRDNRTPMDAALACLGASVTARAVRPPVIAVGDVRDYTGKYSVNEGNAITQGGALMVSSALGKLGGAVGMAERFDPTIGERELGYTDRRQLGDGTVHDVAGTSGPAKVPWLPYYGGSIAASDYFIVGGITELNYDIRSGGLDVEVSQLGPKARTYTQSVAIDLRIVDTRSLLVVKTISLTKQFTGYEVGFNLFQFFGSNLFDINVGAKGEEPLQLGVRTAIEEATLRLVAAVTRTDPARCLASSVPGVIDTVRTGTPGQQAFPAPHPGPVGTALTVTQAGATLADRGAIPLPFEFSSPELAGAEAPLVERIVTASAHGPVEIVLLAHDTETLDPGKRDALTAQRIAAIASALRGRGVRVPVTIVWRADPGGPAVRSSVAGFQDIARLRVGP
ncbi:MAG: putative protein involved in formation of curli polymers-like protein [Bradyrhizobium sp.]|nr:putative protein involved in formation of curli polymers-like protein [Bradyrhizobium sp.]